MKEYLELLKKVKLFSGISSENILDMLKCLAASAKELKKDGFILTAGNSVNNIGIVLEGQLHIVKEDINGERSLIATLAPTDIFGEALCCAGVLDSPVSVFADKDSKVMLLGFSRILKTCSNSCSYHTKLIENMLQMLAQKNLQIQTRMDFLSKKTIRERLISYFNFIALKQGRDFTIPLNREELADFLCINRSALSRELGNLKDEGLINYNKNHFTLLT